MKNNFLNSEFFDFNSFAYEDLLSGFTPWKSVENIGEFIKNLFDKQKLKPNFKDNPYVFIGKGTFIHPAAEIEGPAIIGNNCEIRHAALIRENCILGDNVIVGHTAEIKNTIILNGGIINHFAYAGDSILGNNVNVSAGAKLANLRLDKKIVSIKAGERLIDTGLNKFGAAIGDNCVIGVNSVLNPGTILGKNCIVYPLKSVKGFHPESSRIR